MIFRRLVKCDTSFHLSLRFPPAKNYYLCDNFHFSIYVTTLASVFHNKALFMECYLEEEYIKFNISFIFHFKFPWDSQYARSKSENIVSERRHNLNQKIVTQYDQI